MTESQILTLDEAATYLRVSRKVARNLVKSGELWGRKVGGSWRVRRVDVEALLSPSAQARGGTGSGS